MTKILELAQTFNEQSKKQAESTTASVKAALALHEQTLTEALRSSERSLQGVISESHANSKRALKSQLIMSASVIAGALIIAGGLAAALTWWTSGLALTILEQRQTLAALEAKTGGALIQQTTDGVYLVLPKKADTRIYTRSDGRPAIRLTKTR